MTFRGFEALTVEALRDRHEDNDDLPAANEELRASIEELRDLLGAGRER